MNIPKTGRPKWATHFMYQHVQCGCGGYWLGEKTNQLLGVHPDGAESGVIAIITPKDIKEYLAGQYSLTVKRLFPITLENK